MTSTCINMQNLSFSTIANFLHCMKTIRTCRSSEDQYTVGWCIQKPHSFRTHETLRANTVKRWYQYSISETELWKVREWMEWLVNWVAVNGTHRVLTLEGGTVPYSGKSASEMVTNCCWPFIFHFMWRRQLKGDSVLIYGARRSATHQTLMLMSVLVLTSDGQIWNQRTGYFQWDQGRYCNCTGQNWGTCWREWHNAQSNIINK